MPVHDNKQRMCQKANFDAIEFRNELFFVLGEHQRQYTYIEELEFYEIMKIM